MKLPEQLRKEILTDPDALEAVAKANRFKEGEVEFSDEEVTEWRNKAEALAERYPTFLEYSLQDLNEDSN